MRTRRLNHHLRRGLTHPNRLVAAAAWLLLLFLLLVLARLVAVLVEDFWVIAIAWLQS